MSFWIYLTENIATLTEQIFFFFFSFFIPWTAFMSAAFIVAAGWPGRKSDWGTVGLHSAFLSEMAILMNKFVRISTSNLNC